MGLELVEIIMALEERFDVSIPDKVAEHCITVEDLQKAIAELLASKRKCNVDDLLPEVWQGMVQVVVEQMGMKPADIKPESKWVGDITQYG